MSTIVASRRSWLSQVLQNKVIAIVLAMIIAVPLLAAPADFSLTGAAALTLEVFALVLMTVLVWRSRWDLRRENVQTFLRTGANVPILLFLGWVTLSSVLSPHKVFSLQYLLQIGSGVLLYFTLGYQFRQSKHLLLLTDVLLFLAAAVALGGMAQYQMFDELRARALFGDPQPLGSFVMLLLPVVAALALGDKNPRRQTVAQIVAILMVGCLLLTYGRSAWLGGLAGLLTLGVLSSRVRERREKTRLPLAARKHQFVLPVLLAVIALAFVLAMNTQNAGVASRISTFSKLGADVSWQSRIQTHWQGAVEMIQARPLTGWGAGTFPIYQNEFTGQGVRIAPGGVGTRTSLAEQAHNLYLQTAAELGVIGLGMMLSVLVVFWVMGGKRITQMDAGIRRTLLMGSMAATVGFAVDAISSPSWQYAQTSMFFWLMLGMGTSCLRPRLRRDEDTIPAPAVTRRVMWVTRPVAVAACLGLATLLPSTFATAQTTYGPTTPPAKPGEPGSPAPPGGPVVGGLDPVDGGTQTGGGSGSSIAIGLAAFTSLGYLLFGGDDDDDGPFIIAPA